VALNQVIVHFGDGGDGWRELRTKERSSFISGQFICPHGAWFDSTGNIFVAEYVEVGRVTKLRKLS
jgi:hypothetical protein